VRDGLPGTIYMKMGLAEFEYRGAPEKTAESRRQVADAAVFGIPDPDTGRATTAPSGRRAQAGTVAVSLRTSSSRAVAGGSGGYP
jgi:hypothetical protein